jgi:hypothetical protein
VTLSKKQKIVIVFLASVIFWGLLYILWPSSKETASEKRIKERVVEITQLEADDLQKNLSGKIQAADENAESNFKKQFEQTRKLTTAVETLAESVNKLAENERLVKVVETLTTENASTVRERDQAIRERNALQEREDARLSKEKTKLEEDAKFEKTKEEELAVFKRDAGNEDSRIRANVVLYICKNRKEAGYPIVVWLLLEDADDFVGKTAISGLSITENPAVGSGAVAEMILQFASKSVNKFGRGRAREVLRNIGLPAVSCLVRELRNPDDDYRRWVQGTLFFLGRDAEKDLMLAYTSFEPEISLPAHQVLQAIYKFRLDKARESAKKEVPQRPTAPFITISMPVSVPVNLTTVKQALPAPRVVPARVEPYSRVNPCGILRAVRCGR